MHFPIIGYRIETHQLPEVESPLLPFLFVISKHTPAADSTDIPSSLTSSSSSSQSSSSAFPSLLLWHDTSTNTPVIDCSANVDALRSRVKESQWQHGMRQQLKVIQDSAYMPVELFDRTSTAATT